MTLLGVAAFFILLLLQGNTFANSMFMNAADIIASFEGFRANPYWDFKQYSWGYGTKAPGATGTITKSEALAELMQHVQSDYDYLQQLIHVPLNSNQWAALLSFSYNLGPGNADNLIDNINNQDNEALGVQWNKYINAGGEPDPGLIDRRAKEWRIWNS